jgi:HAD superfamily hydrolase (TIGR01450 family)
MSGPVIPAARLAIADPAAVLRERLAGVRGLVLDADGVIVWRGELLPGASEALATLGRRGIPFRIVTNFSSAHRTTLAARFGGGTIPADRFITAASAAAAHTATRYPGGRLLVVATGDALREFEGQRLLTPAEADADPGAVAAVVIGDAGDDLRFGVIDVAFRCLLAGAGFLAMHRNLWWMTGKGETLDSGALVAGLEAATGRRATIAGKPSAVVFRQALAGIAADLGLRRLPAGSAAMVGDDIRADVLAARAIGLRGVLVLTGKHGPVEVEAAAGRRGGSRPDAIAPSLGDVVAALD